MKPDRSKTIEELDNIHWGEPNFDSYFVKECHRLAKIPIKNLSAGNLRILIGQHICLEHLIPIALEILDTDPMVEGDGYRGDLLASVASIDATFWIGQPELNNHFCEIIGEVKLMLTTIQEQLPKLNAFKYS